ncbi:MAG: LL-diaminopimelate aminotransferase [Clostridiales bacterium]|jgi:LL-diaminopimelate aminotransferase|nr:LL-diaminopimelate aminotransferase [Clostridiales bacterium]
MKINANFFNLKDDYLFATVADKVAAYKRANPGKDVIRLGIGDVTLPLPPAVVKAMAAAALEMGQGATFRGYGEYRGYPFLQEAVAKYYEGKGVALEDSEIFIGDGAKSELGNILDVFDKDNTVLIPDPVYPVYVDTNVMAGRRAIFQDGNAGNAFLPLPDESVKADIIYICSPNNPTGAVYGKAGLKKWVDYARAQNAVILFDAAYEAFVRDSSLPTSIYQIEGADTCCIEFCSLSKTAGFTGTRCGYTVVPHKLKYGGAELNKLWYRRQSTKFNGTAYVIQRAAEAVFTPEGFDETRVNIAYYLGNAKVIGDSLKKLSIWFTGGENSPYIWLKCPNNLTSWEFFDFLLNEANVVGTPGVGFGKNGEGFFRLTAFGDRENVVRAVERVERLLS